MEQVSSMVSNGGGSVAMQRDDEYRNRIMKSKCVASGSRKQRPPQAYPLPRPTPNPITQRGNETGRTTIPDLLALQLTYLV